MSDDMQQILAMRDQVKVDTDIMENMVINKEIEPLLWKLAFLSEIEATLLKNKYLETLSPTDIFTNFLGFWDQDLPLPEPTLSTEDNMALLSFKMRALHGPREPVQMMTVDESVRKQVEEVRWALTQAERKIDAHVASVKVQQSFPVAKVERLV